MLTVQLGVLKATLHWVTVLGVTIEEITVAPKVSLSHLGKLIRIFPSAGTGLPIVIVTVNEAYCPTVGSPDLTEASP